MEDRGMNLPGLDADVFFGSIDAAPPDWREIDEAIDDENDPDDEELEATPDDVLAVLGFDPLGETEESD
jgi:hypothetical protein